MPERNIGWGRKANRRNKYMMLIVPKVDVSENSTEWLLLNSLLCPTAECAYKKDSLAVSGTIGVNADGKYCGTVLPLPETKSRI